MDIRRYSPGRREEFLEWLDGSRRTLGIDTETTGLGWGDTVRLVQIGDARGAWVLRADRDLGIITEAITGRRFVAWNLAFDATHLHRLTGVRIDATDTAVLAGVLDPSDDYQGGVGRSLKAWAEHVIGPEATEPEKALKAYFKATYGKVEAGWAQIDADHPLYVRYAGVDPIITVRVHEHLVPLVRERADVVRREQSVAAAVGRLRENGLLLDSGLAEEMRMQYATDLAEATASLAALGITSYGSSGQIARQLEAEGLEEFIEHTEMGNVSVPKSVLKKAGVSGSAVAPLVLRAKKAKRYGRDFIEGYQAAAAADGRVHPSIKPIGAKTRRMSSSRPNMQNIPKDGGLRMCFRADEGETLVAADYNQMELRYAAYASGDMQLAYDLEHSPDMFVDLAEEVWPGNGRAMRTQAKIATYANMYGAGPKRMADITGLTLPDAQRLLATFWDKYPTLRDLRDSSRATLKAQGGVYLERSGFLPSNPQKPHVALNLLIQGSCRDLLAERLLAIGETDRLRMLVHDEVIYSVPTPDVEDFIAHLHDTMPVTDVGIGIGVKTGTHWGALS